jgi:hypothetical protein
MRRQYQTGAAANGKNNLNGNIMNIDQTLNVEGSANWELAAVVPIQLGSF